MAAPKRPTHMVSHPRLYFTVALPGQDRAKFQLVPAGTQVTLTAKQAKGFGSRVGPIGAEVATLPDDGDEDLRALKARAAELNLEGSSRWGESRLVEEIGKAEAAIAAGNALTG